MNPLAQQDTRMMALALKLAQKGIYTTTPNPNVGCVVVSADGEVAGQGWHQRAGEPHAEVYALREAGERARGGTAYVTLEPCSHHGRTPPCAEALISAGVSRVVIAMQDPNPKVAGRGIQMLADAGIHVSTGLMSKDAEQLNRGFCKRMLHGKPWVTVKLASTLDGKTALNNGKSQWITGPLARQDVQRFRASSCAILSGSGTVMADNPALNVRHGELGYVADSLDAEHLRQPRRVILDGRNQLAGELRIFAEPGEVLVINSALNLQLPPDVEQWQAPYTDRKLDLAAVFTHLGEMQINNLWVEAGSRLAGALLQEKLIDELILYQAPKLMGDDAQGLFAMPALTEMDAVCELDITDLRMLGRDIRITAHPRY